MKTDVSPKEILLKEPFRRIMPSDAPRNPYVVYGDHFATSPNDRVAYQILSQADFLREYYVTGHKINSRQYYPDREKVDEDTGRITLEIMSRCAFPFQYIITIKQLAHLCGNNIEFKISTPLPTQSEYKTLDLFMQGWIHKNMEVAWYESAKSEKITGDCAMCGFMYNGEFRYRILSYLQGDVLYPHYDDMTGDLDAFGRRFSKYDSKGKEVIQYLEVWDNDSYYKFEQITSGVKGTINKALEYFGLDGWKLIASSPHGFPFIPIAYKRSDIGPCWSMSQDNIENYELAVSYLSENNKAFAFPILYIFSGEQVEIKASQDGRPNAITSGDPSGKAGFAERGNGTQSFELQLKILLDNIFRGSFAVNPPEIKGGDLPGVTVKLIYSPALEKAMADANEWNSYVDHIVNIFKYGYGIEMGKISDFTKLKVRGEIIPYVHQNVAETVSNLVQLVAGGILSKESASSQSTYGSNGEYSRILKEERDKIMGLGREQNKIQDEEDKNNGMNENNRNKELIANAQDN